MRDLNSTWVNHGVDGSWPRTELLTGSKTSDGNLEEGGRICVEPSQRFLFVSPPLWLGWKGRQQSLNTFLVSDTSGQTVVSGGGSSAMTYGRTEIMTSRKYPFSLVISPRFARWQTQGDTAITSSHAYELDAGKENTVMMKEAGSTSVGRETRLGPDK